MDGLTELLQNVSLREELPDDYQGDLNEEFQVMVALETLACIALGCQRKALAELAHASIRKFIHLVNSFYFTLHSDKAPRITDQDTELAQAHAMQDLTLQDVPLVGEPTAHANAQVVANKHLLDQAARIASNVCTECLENLDFVLSEHGPSMRKTNKDAYKRLQKIKSKIKTLLHLITKPLDKQAEEAHKFTSNVSYAQMTEHEKAMKARKRRAR